MIRRMVAFLSLALLAPWALADDSGVQEMVKKVAPSIVTVKVVVSVDASFGGQSQNQESREELPGVVVDPSGLVMLSSAGFDSSGLKDLLKSAGRGGDVDIKTTPTEFKVIFEQEEKEYDAFLAATDTKLNLGFVQVADLGDRKLAAVSFDGGAEPSVGQSVIAIGRMKKGYDYAPYATWARVSGRIAKPREAWLVDAGLAGDGLPVFTSSGALFGVMGEVSVPSSEEDSNARGMRMLRSLMGGGRHAGGPPAHFVFPPSVIKGVVEQAKKQAVEVAKERASKKDEPKDDKKDDKKDKGDKKGDPKDNDDDGDK